MKYLHQIQDSEEMSLAFDEALLMWAEEVTPGYGIVRFWESRDPFVVVGFSNRIEREVYADRCREDGVKILRRITGGGTVVQGPGCFNYSLVLPIDLFPDLESVTSTNRFIMGKLAESVSNYLGAGVDVAGHTDLVFRGQKFSGNAQRRKRRYLLFHGTLLYDFELDWITRYLQFPSITPDYRNDKSHHEFVCNIPASSMGLTESIQATWNASEPLGQEIIDHCQSHSQSLTSKKYTSDAWNFRV